MASDSTNIALFPVPYEQFRRNGVRRKDIGVRIIPHLADEDGFIEPRRDLLDVITARYGEDFGDLVDSIIWLYLNPGIKEDPDIGTPEDDPRARARWNVKSALTCLGHPDLHPIINTNIEKLREIDSRHGRYVICRRCSIQFFMDDANHPLDRTACYRCNDLEQEAELGLL